MISIFFDYCKTLDGRVFKFAPADPKSKATAYEKATAHAATRRRALENYIGHSLTDDEFLSSIGTHQIVDRAFFQRDQDSADARTLEG